MIKKISVGLLVSFISVTNVFAEKNDWDGTFHVRNALDKVETIKHTSDKVSYQFISAGKCIKIDKGVKLNGVLFENDFNICVNQNVNEFENEVQKIGVIVDKVINLGPTYKE